MCSPGNPQYDITEVINDAGDEIHRKLFRELEDIRKLLIVFRLVNHKTPFPDIELNIKNREKQLCKPLIRLFQNAGGINDTLVQSLSKYITEKNNKKLGSLDFYLYSIVKDLTSNDNRVSNELLWDIICQLPGNDIPYKPHSYQTDEFGIISKSRISKTCEDKFGAKKTHDGKQRYLLFDKKTVDRLADNYTPIKKIEILNRKSTNTSNTFNTFWRCVEGTRIHDNGLKGDRLTNSGQKTIKYEGNREGNDESNNNSLMDIRGNEDSKPAKVLEVLEVLENERQTENKIRDGSERKYKV